MLILEKLFGARSNALFDEVIDHDHIKKLFQTATTSNEPTHILLTGLPASTKTMFLLSLRHLKEFINPRISSGSEKLEWIA